MRHAGGAGIKIVLAGLSLLAAGCASPGLVDEIGAAPDPGRPGSLVLSPWGADYYDHEDKGPAWEIDRNDASMGIGGVRGLEQQERVEIQTTDRRWTSTGRVREYSRTTVRTLREGRLRSR